MSGAASAVGKFLGFGGGPEAAPPPVAPTYQNSQAQLQKAATDQTQAEGQAADIANQTGGAYGTASLSRQVLLGS